MAGAARKTLPCLLALAAGLAACGGATSSRRPLLVLERAIVLPGVGGRIDHLAVDVAHRRLFVAELGAGSVETVDLDGAKPIRRISGLNRPQGVAYLPGRDELAVASGGDGTVRFYRATDLAPVGVIAVGDDADNLRVDPRNGRLVVGYGDGALAVIDPVTRTVVSRLPLPAHPESFRLDGARVFVNLPGASAVAAGDLDQGRVTATWKAAHRWNFPMVLDPGAGAVVSVYRFPARLVVQDAATGATRGDVATCGDADDVFLDARRARFYVVCGSGAVDVTSSQPPYARLARQPSRSGARTGLFVPGLDRLYVAARAGPGGEDAAILVFRPVD